MRHTAFALLVLATTVARADDAAESNEATRDAIRDRGIVLKANKRTYFVIVPPKEVPSGMPADTKLRGGHIYFGDAKALFEQDSQVGSVEKGREYVDLQDPRALFGATLQRTGDTYNLECELVAAADDAHEKRSFSLTPADGTTAAKLAKASLRSVKPDRAAYFVGRTGTTYLFVDLQGPVDKNDFRFFIGKRGALKRVPIKDIANDSNSLVLVTAKGTLTISKGKASAEATATYGTKKQDPITVLPVYQNRKLIYRELGVYNNDRLGHPCHEL